MSTNPDSKRSLKSRKYWSPLRSRVSTAIVRSVYEKAKADLKVYVVAVDRDELPATVRETHRARINDAIGAALMLFNELPIDDKRRVRAMKAYLRLASIRPEDTVLPGHVPAEAEDVDADEALASIAPHDEQQAAGEPEAADFVAPPDFGAALATA